MPHISLLGLQLPQAALQPASVQQPPDSPEDKNTTGVMPSISGSKTVPTCDRGTYGTVLTVKGHHNFFLYHYFAGLFCVLGSARSHHINSVSDPDSLNTDPDPGVCWIRIWIQAEVGAEFGSRPRFFMKKIFFKSTTVISVFLNPYKATKDIQAPAQQIGNT
jgi:hypothetical protein